VDLVALFLVAVALVGVYIAWPVGVREDEGRHDDIDGPLVFDVTKTNLQLGKAAPLEAKAGGDRY
jgi:hypothetical protein